MCVFVVRCCVLCVLVIFCVRALAHSFRTASYRSSRLGVHISDACPLCSGSSCLTGRRHLFAFFCDLSSRLLSAPRQFAQGLSLQGSNLYLPCNGGYVAAGLRPLRTPGGARASIHDPPIRYSFSHCAGPFLWMRATAESLQQRLNIS